MNDGHEELDEEARTPENIKISKSSEPCGNTKQLVIKIWRPCFKNNTGTSQKIKQYIANDSVCY